LKRNSALTVLLVLGLAACSNEPQIRVSLEIPGSAAVRRENVRSLVVAGFYREKPSPAFDVNAILVRYFLDEFKTQIKGPVEAVPIAWPGPEALTDKEFWKKSGGGKNGLILTGKTEFIQETRKALIEGERRDFDGPFKPKSPWAERKFFSLQLELAVIDARTGEPVFRKDYKEAVNSENLKQTAEFAVYDLMGRIKIRFLRALFGSERPLDRYLLAK
jgi:hypothetical protein